MSLDNEDIAFVKSVSLDEDDVTIYRSRDGMCNKGDFVVDGWSRETLCASVRENVCPSIGGERGVAIGISGGERSFYDGDDQMSFMDVRCGYSKNVFESETSIKDYSDTFGSDEDFPLLLQEACFKTTTECPIDPLTEKKMPLCSVYVSTGSSGEICRQEALVPSNQNTFEREMENYCRENSTPDCRCIDRVSTQVYDSLRTSDVTEDGCWWKWCSNTSDFLVPPKIVLGKDPQTCPDVLKKVANEINANASNIECCQIQKNVIYAPDGVTPLPVNCFFNDALVLERGWFSSYGWVIVMFVVLFIVLLGIIAIWASHAHHKRI